MIYIFFLILLCCSGCSRIKVQPELRTIKKNTHNDLGVQTSWQRIDKTHQEIQQNINQSVKNGLTQDGAISIAVQNNPELQAAFEEIGIAKADLKEAGFFTNPRLETLFKVPIKNRKDNHTNIDLDASITLSDFWQVPLRKKIAHDDLQMMTLHVLRHIQMICKEASLAFYECIYAQVLYNKTLEILNQVITIRDRIYRRHKFGYTSDLDMYYADIMVDIWRVEKEKQLTNIHHAFVALQRTLGIPITGETMPLIQTQSNTFELPPLNYVKNVALTNRPEVKIAHLNIQKAEHTLTYEQSRVFKDVTAGVAFEREFEKKGTKGIGPLFGIEIPILNTNSAQIERAQFEVNRTRALKQAEILLIEQEVHHAYTNAQKFMNQVDIYRQGIIPSSTKAIEYAQTYYKSMQMNRITYLDTIKTLYEQEKNKIELELQAAQALVHLEAAMSKRLHLLDENIQL